MRKKKRRERLIALAQRSGWVWGFQAETWWSRFAPPKLSSGSDEQQPLRLVEQVKAKADPEPKALACYGRRLRWLAPEQLAAEKMRWRFVEGRPLSAITIQFLAWACQQVHTRGQSVLVLLWDKARWHTRTAVRSWIREPNRTLKRTAHRLSTRQASLAQQQ